MLIMTPNPANQSWLGVQAPHWHSPALCPKTAAQLEQAKAAVLSEFQDGLADHAHLLRLALNEAEALAWQTGYPHLLFPALAMEKAQAVAHWHTRQRSLQPVNVTRVQPMNVTQAFAA